MKKYLLVLLVLLGLQTQAQILSPCDSTMSYTTGSQFQLEIAFGVGGNTPSTWSAPLYAVTYGDGNMLAEDSCFANACTHMIYNYNPVGGYYDTLTTCVSYITSDSIGNIDTLMCCFNQYWNGQSWARMMQQQPYFCCDSITYWTDQSQGLTVGLDTTNMIHNPDSMTVYWGVCTGFAGTGTCYAGDGISDYFPQVTTSDTIKVGYDVYIYENGVAEVCSMEDWLIFDGSNWVPLNNTPTSINEITLNKINDNKIYDLLGRELTNIPVGKLYIKNQKLYITR